MFERFTDRARRVVVLAQEEARLLNHNWIGTEHILLGLISESDGVAAKVLEQLGISQQAVREKVELIIGEGDKAPGSHIPFTPRAKKVLELSLREALQLGHNYIGTEHILLGLIREGEGVGAQVLVNLGADLSSVRQGVIQQLSGYAVRGRRGGPAMSEPRRETPAVSMGAVEARRLAGSSPVGSHHYLLGLLADQQSMAAKALAELGVTREAVEQKLGELDPAGTSDETPEEAGARRIRMRVEGKVVTLEIDDPELATSLEQAMTGRKVRIITGGDPEAEGFPNLWAAVSRTVDDMTRRLGQVTVSRVSSVRGAARSSARGEWRPPGWHEGGHAAVYWIVNSADGPSAHLQIGAEGDRSVRAWLRQWLAENGPRLAEGPPRGREGVRSLWAYVDREGDSFAMTSFGFGAEGPPGCQPVSLDTLVEAAVADLA